MMQETRTVFDVALLFYNLQWKCINFKRESTEPSGWDRMMGWVDQEEGRQWSTESAGALTVVSCGLS